MTALTKQIKDELRYAESTGKNLYWHRGENLPALRVVRVRTRTYKLCGASEQVAEVCTLPDLEWIMFKDPMTRLDVR